MDQASSTAPGAPTPSPVSPTTEVAPAAAPVAPQEPEQETYEGLGLFQETTREFDREGEAPSPGAVAPVEPPARSAAPEGSPLEEVSKGLPVQEQTPVPQAPAPQAPAQPSREALVAGIAEYYKGEISDEEVAEFGPEPDRTKTVLGKIAARVYADAVQGTISEVVGKIVGNLPEMVHHVIQTRGREGAVEEAFFKEYPELVPHRQDALQFAQAIRLQMPKASLVEVARRVAHATAAIHGVTLGQATPPVKPNGGGTFGALLPPGPRVPVGTPTMSPLESFWQQLKDDTE